MDDHFDALFRDEYSQILALARARLARENTPISTMTLVHELYLNLNQRTDLHFGTREQFFAYAGRAMRSLLVDMARERMAQKRSAELLPLTMAIEVADGGGTPEQILAMDDALERLSKINPRLPRVAEMRLILGLDLAVIATALNISVPTVKRDLQHVKAFLHEALGAQQ